MWSSWMFFTSCLWCADEVSSLWSIFLLPLICSHVREIRPNLNIKEPYDSRRLSPHINFTLPVDLITATRACNTIYNMQYMQYYIFHFSILSPSFTEGYFWWSGSANTEWHLLMHNNAHNITLNIQTLDTMGSKAHCTYRSPMNTAKGSRKWSFHFIEWNVYRNLNLPSS